MFATVLAAALTYCVSILIRVRSWDDMAPKLPFFTDAALGAVLDVVILGQFIAYRGNDPLGSTPTLPALTAARPDNDSSSGRKDGASSAAHKGPAAAATTGNSDTVMLPDSLLAARPAGAGQRMG